MGEEPLGFVRAEGFKWAIPFSCVAASLSKAAAIHDCGLCRDCIAGRLDLCHESLFNV